MSTSPASIDGNHQLLDEDRDPDKRKSGAPEQIAALTSGERPTTREGHKAEATEQIDTGDHEQQRRGDQEPASQEHESERTDDEIRKETERVAQRPPHQPRSSLRRRSSRSPSTQSPIVRSNQ
jgi:hypothetical protein